jgi:hypothetical protein
VLYLVSCCYLISSLSSLTGGRGRRAASDCSLCRLHTWVLLALWCPWFLNWSGIRCQRLLCPWCWILEFFGVLIVFHRTPRDFMDYDCSQTIHDTLPDSRRQLLFYFQTMTVPTDCCNAPWTSMICIAIADMTPEVTPQLHIYQSFIKASLLWLVACTNVSFVEAPMENRQNHSQTE